MTCVFALDLINNLDVGFYSAYLVAHKVTVTSKHNDHDQYMLDSAPSASFIVTKDINGQQISRGTTITLFLNDDQVHKLSDSHISCYFFYSLSVLKQLQYLQETTIKNLISKHCQLIAHPIYLWSENNKDHWQLINIWFDNQEMRNTFVGQKLGNHLPNSLAFSILSKLPLKSLKRFGCLHKSWALLFENSNFVNLFHINFLSNQHSYYDDTSILLCLIDKSNNKSSLFSVYGKEELNWSNKLIENILGSSSINGIICLYLNNIVYLWNPSTTEFKVIPPSPVEYAPDNVHIMFKYQGFGYDCSRDDYKVIRYAFSFPPDNEENELDCEEWDVTMIWEIYSLRSNSWRKLDIDVPKCTSFHDKFYFEGICHWLDAYGDYSRAERYLVSFDLSNEECYTTPTPIDIPLELYDNFDINLMVKHLFLLNGRIAVISNYHQTTTFYISILGEIGKKETWTKLWTIGPLPGLSFPIGTWNTSNILFQTHDGKLAWFDLRTHFIDKLDVNVHNDICQLIVYKEILLPMNK